MHMYTFVPNFAVSYLTAGEKSGGSHFFGEFSAAVNFSAAATKFGGWVSMVVMMMMMTMSMVYLQETESNLELERSASQEARETSMVLERKLISAQTELDDLRSLLEAVSMIPAVSACVLNGLHLIMHRTIGLTGYIGPLTLTLFCSSVSPIVRCIIKCQVQYMQLCAIAAE